MTLIVETGAGVPGAESYVTVAFADDYFAARNVSSWALLDENVKEAALRRATEFLSEQYDGDWKGNRVFFDQPLAWPRMYVALPDSYDVYYPSDAIPQSIQRAVCELALISSRTDLYNPNGNLRLPTEISKKIGPIQTTTKYSSASSVGSLTPTIATDRIDALLGPFLAQVSFGQLRVDRA